MDHLPEPWLRGPIPGVHALLSPPLYSFQQAREDIARSTEGLTTRQLWATPHGFGSLGFHILHITGSVDRLTTYLEVSSFLKRKWPRCGQKCNLARRVKNCWRV